jgi:hypothetical protein
MPDWSIEILPIDPAKPKGSARFNSPGRPPGTPLIAQDGDMVAWNNTTDAEHQPWATDASYSPLPVKPNGLGYISDAIPAGDSSTPAYSAARPILIVEGDPTQQEILVESLGINSGFEAHVAAALGEADLLLGAEDARFDAVVLGLEMPDGSGHGYCSKLRLLGQNANYHRSWLVR